MTDCQEYEGKRKKTGYGYLYMGRMYVFAHRLAWALHNGEDPGSRYVRHKCDNPSCVNPEHLEIGTPQQNVDDKVSRGRHPTGHASALSKLTPMAVEAIRASSLTQRVLAMQYGVSQSTISDVRTLKKYT